MPGMPDFLKAEKGPLPGRYEGFRQPGSWPEHCRIPRSCSWRTRRPSSGTSRAAGTQRGAAPSACAYASRRRGL